MISAFRLSRRPPPRIPGENLNMHNLIKKFIETPSSALLTWERTRNLNTLNLRLLINFTSTADANETRKPHKSSVTDIYSLSELEARS